MRCIAWVTATEQRGHGARRLRNPDSRHQANRREFVATVLTLLGGAAVTSGCGGGSSSPSSPTPTPTSSGSVLLAGTVADNHPDPHVAVITAAQLGAGGALTLDISSSRHSRTVTLLGAEVTRIAAGSRVSAMSSTNPIFGRERTAQPHGDIQLNAVARQHTARPNCSPKPYFPDGPSIPSRLTFFPHNHLHGCNPLKPHRV